MNRIKRNPMLTVVLCMSSVVLVQIGRVAAAHTQKPESSVIVTIGEQAKCWGFRDGKQVRTKCPNAG